MNWEALGAIGELLGAAAVVSTLAYLAVQVRQNSKGMKVAAKQEMTRQFSDYCDMLLSHDNLFEIHFNGTRNGDLSDSDRERFNLLMLKAFWYFASMHYQHNAHSLDEDDWIQGRLMIKDYCRLRGVKEWWYEINARGFSPGFITFIESHWQEGDV